MNLEITYSELFDDVASGSSSDAPAHAADVDTIVDFYNAHMHRSISHTFLTWCVFSGGIRESLIALSPTITKAVVGFITHHEISPALLSSSIYVGHLAVAMYFTSPDTAGCDLARKYLADFLAGSETNKHKKWRAMLICAELNVIDKEYQAAANTFEIVATGARQLTAERALGLIGLLKVTAIHMARIMDAHIMLTDSFRDETFTLFSRYPYARRIVNALMAFVYCKVGANIDAVERYILASIVANNSAGNLLALAQLFDKVAGCTVYALTYYMRAAEAGNNDAILVVVNHWISHHLQDDVAATPCNCHLSKGQYASCIIFYMLGLMPTYPDLQTPFIKTVAMYVDTYIYEYKCIAGIIVPATGPRYRGADVIAHRLDLLAKQRIYLANFINPAITHCDICQSEGHVVCYTYACGRHAFCRDCTANISRRENLRRCPFCSIPEHPYFKNIWSVKWHPIWNVPRSCATISTTTACETAHSDIIASV